MTKLQEFISKHPIKCIVLWGLFLRLLILTFYGHATIFPDSYGYFKLADYISRSAWMEYDGSRSPGYPFLVFLAFGKSYITVAYQLVLGLLSTIIIYYTILLLWNNKKEAFLFSFLSASYLPIIFYEYAVLTETLTFFLITAIFYLFLKLFLRRTNSVTTYLLLAIVCAFLVLVKPFYIYLPVCLFLCLLINERLRQSIAKSLFLIVLPFLSFFGWSYVNKLSTGHFVSTTLYGYNMAQNCVRFAGQTTEEFSDIAEIYVQHRDSVVACGGDVAMSLWYANNDLKAHIGLHKYGDMSELLSRYAASTIRMNPVGYLKQVFISWIDFWKVELYWGEGEFLLPAMRPVILMVYQIQAIPMQLVKIFFLLLIPVCLYRSFRSRKITVDTVISILVLAASLLQAFSTYGTNTRYSFPFEILILISVLYTVNSFKRSD